MKASNVLYLIFFGCVFFCGVCIICDWLAYNSTLNSAPFYVMVVSRLLLFLIPAAICLIVSKILKKKGR